MINFRMRDGCLYLPEIIYEALQHIRNLCTQVKKGRSNGMFSPANRAAVSMLIQRASTLLPGRGPHEVRSGGIIFQQRHTTRESYSA